MVYERSLDCKSTIAGLLVGASACKIDVQAGFATSMVLSFVHVFNTKRLLNNGSVLYICRKRSLRMGCECTWSP